MRRFPRSTTAMACVALGACLPLAARALAGPRGADVHVRWQAAVDDRTRPDLEAQFHLAGGRRLDQSTWRYDLLDPSTENIRALVASPAVADTHDLDRARHSLTPSAIRTGRRLRIAHGDLIVTAADNIAIALIALGAILRIAGMWRIASPARALASRVAAQLKIGGPRVSGYVATAHGSIRRFLVRGVPEVDARTAGLFRIAFGLLVLMFLWTRAVDSSWLNATFDLEIEGTLHSAVLDGLRAHPVVVDLLTPWLLVTGAAFTAGLCTRISYGLFAAGALLWAYVAVSLDSTHPHSTLMIAVVALLPSRWGDALSVDAWLRRRRRGQVAAKALPPGKHYGYSVWVPVLTFGVGYAAAAYAKIIQGPEWVLNGTVKYHFITDSVIAPFDWGLQLVNYPRLAIAASLFAVLTEALVITAAFTRSEVYRATLGVASVGLLGGFWVFMGHFWPGWWIQLIGFLPWRRLSQAGVWGADSGRPEKDGRIGLANAAQLATITAVIGQQIFFSTVRIERAPMFSYYPMYSGTYASLTDYEASRPPRYRILASTDQGAVELRCSAHEEFVREFQAALRGSTDATRSVWRALSGCGQNLASVRDVTLEGDVRVFNPERLDFTLTQGAVVLGPLRATGRAGGVAD